MGQHLFKCVTDTNKAKVAALFTGILSYGFASQTVK